MSLQGPIFKFKTETHLSCSLQVSKVDVWDEEDRLGVQVSHALKQSCIRSPDLWRQPQTVVFPWTQAQITRRHVLPVKWLWASLRQSEKVTSAFLDFTFRQFLPLVLFLSCFLSSSRSFLSAPWRYNKGWSDRICYQFLLWSCLLMSLIFYCTLHARIPHLVTEDLDLSGGPVNGPAAATVVAVGVHLD